MIVGTIVLSIHSLPFGHVPIDESHRPTMVRYRVGDGRDVAVSVVVLPTIVLVTRLPLGRRLLGMPGRILPIVSFGVSSNPIPTVPSLGRLVSIVAILVYGLFVLESTIPALLYHHYLLVLLLVVVISVQSVEMPWSYEWPVVDDRDGPSRNDPTVVVPPRPIVDGGGTIPNVPVGPSATDGPCDASPRDDAAIRGV